MTGITYTIDFAAAIARLEEGTKQGARAVTKMSDQMESAANFAKNALAGLGVALGAASFVSLLKSTNDAVAHMKELGQEAGTSAEAISRFEAPARTAGLGLDNVASAIFKMNRALLEAKDPQSNAAQALRAIGISTQQLKGLKPDEMFELTARQLAKYGDGLSKNNVMQELFGKSGREMNRVVAEIAEQGKLVATVTNEQAEAAKLLDKQIVELKMNSEKAWRSIVSEGVPAMSKILKAFLDARKEGSLLDATIAAIQQTLTGDDQYKNDKRLTELTSRKLELENKILEVRQMESQGVPSFAGASAADWEKALAQVNAELRTTLAMREQLAAQSDTGEPPEPKEGPKFDPKGTAAALAAAQAQANAFIAFNEQIAKDNAAMWDETNKDVLKNQEIIAQGRLQVAALYAAALRNENLSEEENVSDFALREAEKARIEEEGLKSRYGIQKVYHQLNAESASSFFGALGGMMVSHNRAAFQIGKAAAISQTIIDTYRGAQGAYASLSSIPFVGHAMGIAAAAAAIVVGMARVQQIRSTQFGGGGGGGGGSGGSVPTFSANPSTGVPTAPISPLAGQPGLGTTPSAVEIHVTVINNGTLVGQDGIQQLVDEEIIPAFKDAIDNRSVIIIGPNSRQSQDLRGSFR